MKINKGVLGKLNTGINILPSKFIPAKSMVVSQDIWDELIKLDEQNICPHCDKGWQGSLATSFSVCPVCKGNWNNK